MKDDRLPIVLDVGNSRVRAARPRGDGPRWSPAEGWCRGGDWEALGRWDTPPEREVGGFLAAVAETVVAAGPGPLIVTSVVPHVARALGAAGTAVHVVGPDWSLPFAVAVRRPEQVGADRLCNVAAAVAAGLTHAVIVDVGTATTIDILRRGRFEGGFIAPGMALGAGALAAGTAQLPAAGFARGPLQPGRDTNEAMTRGTYHVAVEGVRTVALRLAAAEDGAPLIITGGLAEHLADAGFVDPDWTLRGALELARRQGLVAP